MTTSDCSVYSAWSREVWEMEKKMTVEDYIPQTLVTYGPACNVWRLDLKISISIWY